MTVDAIPNGIANGDHSHSNGVSNGDNTLSLLQRIERLEAMREIENLLGRRMAYHSAGRHDLEIEHLWSHRDDICFEGEDWGAWEGYEAVKKSYVDGNPYPNGHPGMLVEHLCCTGVIEVAEDGQTAKGTWISPGHETFPIEGYELPQPHWNWGRYGIDFIKEDGKWKIWHLHVITTFRIPYHQDWVQVGLKRPDYFGPEGTVPDFIKMKPNRGVSFNAPYHPHRGPQMQPPPPEPYKTWKDTWSAVEYHEYKG